MEPSGANLNAAGSNTQFVHVEEEEDESDDESMMERCDDVSDATSAMIRVDGSEATSIMRGDDATSQSESVMERVEATESDLSSSMGAPQPLVTAQVPKELRQLGRTQGSVADLGVATHLGNKSLETQVRSTSNMATIKQF